MGQGREGSQNGACCERATRSGGSGDSAEHASESPRPWGEDKGPHVPQLPSGCLQLRLQPEALVPGAPARLLGGPERETLWPPGLRALPEDVYGRTGFDNFKLFSSQ